MIEALSGTERLSLVTPLGIRFRDEVSGEVVGEGLYVTAYPQNNPALRVQAVVNSLGVYTLRNVPGLRNFEHGAGDADFWRTLPPGRPFIVEVVDSDRRFQPFCLPVVLPERGIFPWQCGGTPPSPDAAPAMVPLFSAPTRPVPGGMAAVRAQLWDPIAQTYAAGAVLEANAANRLPVRGFADALGRVVLIFPYPEPVDFVLGSPSLTHPVEANVPLTNQTWPVQFRAFYAPQYPVPLIPDLCTTLTQAPAGLWEDTAHTKPFSGATLHFGQGLVVHSADSAQSVLFITPAGSPS
ncbi:MAG TPA: hypothetical protein VF043_18010 [Ktedonobacteraceae bacterium]